MARPATGALQTTRPGKRTLTGSALALMGNTGITSLLGLGFWILASRLYPPEVLGQDTGLIAAMMLLSSLSELSLHQGIPRLLPQVLRRRRLVVLAAYATTGVVAVVLATAFVLIAPAVSPGFRFLGADHALQALLVGSVVLWNVFALQDAVLAGVRRPIFVPVENGVFGVLKIALLVVFATYGAGYGATHGVLAAWLIAMVAVLPPVSWLLFGRLLERPTGAAAEARALPLADRGRIARYLGGDYAATLLTQGCTSLLPVLVLATLGNAASAYFYVAFTIAGTLNAVALALGVSLVAEAAHDEAALAGLARRALAWWAALLVPAILVLIAGVPLLLRPFGAAYVEHATPVLQLLLAGCIPLTLVTVYLGMERVRGRAGRVLRTQALAFAVMLAALALLVPLRGLDGVGLAWIAAWAATSAAVLPALWQVVGPGRRALAGGLS
jgi:O-antigen/teichoic acid export membrane protein